MSASITPYWEYDRDAPVACPTCGWSGAAKSGEQAHDELLDVKCPKCSQMLLIVPLPTVEETRAAAAAGNPGAQAELPNVDRIEKRWQTVSESTTHAREAIGTYVENYHHRPHSGLDYRTPTEVAQTWKDGQDHLTPAA